jgi:hypothetical protein
VVLLIQGLEGCGVWSQRRSWRGVSGAASREAQSKGQQNEFFERV